MVSEESIISISQTKAHDYKSQGLVQTINTKSMFDH